MDRPFLNWIGLDHVGALVEIHLQALWLGVDQVHVNAADIISSPRVFAAIACPVHLHRTSWSKWCWLSGTGVGIVPTVRSF
ncbi:hypothetical protein BGZ60DRAFT_424391 [Tricladium varicosporioides]|nr:hypothetical protein BGZ60DRAFT_424391 [Hymenoscyphus varicosporioides]